MLFFWFKGVPTHLSSSYLWSLYTKLHFFILLCKGWNNLTVIIKLAIPAHKHSIVIYAYPQACVSGVTFSDLKIFIFIWSVTNFTVCDLRCSQCCWWRLKYLGIWLCGKQLLPFQRSFLPPSSGWSKNKLWNKSLCYVGNWLGSWHSKPIVK